MANSSLEKICIQVATMSKAEVKQQILHFKGPLRLDFTDDFLEKLDLDKLRHILLAAFLTAHRKQAS